MSLRCCLLVLAVLSPAAPGMAQPQAETRPAPAFLRRAASDVPEKADDLSADKVHYRPFFGRGDAEAAILKSIARFGEVTLDPDGTTRIVSYDREEEAWFVLEGSGTLHYGNEQAPIQKNDIMYLPVGVKHGLANTSTRPLRVLIMGYRIPQGQRVPPTAKLMLASADEVPLQVLGQHGPTTQFKLLMGTTRSTRDKLPASQRINSVFLMNFAAQGTNIPHKHAGEEEIYYVLRGRGEMVAGAGADGKEMRYSCKEGDVFYFPPNTLIGFYSGAKEGEPHDQIIAVRSPVR